MLHTIKNSMIISLSSISLLAHSAEIIDTTNTIVLDNLDNNCITTGDWRDSRGTNPYANTSQYLIGNKGTFAWNGYLSNSGNYDVQVWWTYYDNRTQAATYEFETQDGVKSVTLNQLDLTQSGQWVSLGQYAMNSGNISITLRNSSTDGTLSADAVRLVPHFTNSIVLDNLDSSSVATGSWRDSKGSNPYANHSQYIDGNRGTFTWNGELPINGKYDIQVWWTYYDNRTQAATYEFNTQAGIKNVSLNQRNSLLAGQWISLGQYEMNSGDISVTLSNNSSSGTLSADAVKFVFESTSSTVTKSLKLTWQPPTSRQNGSHMEIDEIGGYEILYRKKGETLFSSVIVNDPYQTEYTLTDLTSNDYEIKISSFDIYDNYGEQSDSLMVAL